MIKNHGDRKLSKTGSHRRAMFANMLSSLVINEKVMTTLAKAKELSKFFDRTVNAARKQNYSDLKSILRNKEAFKKMVEVIAPRYKDRKSGFTSVLKVAERRGDAAMVALVRLVD